MTSKKPTVILCIGMAGSGKTTFMQRLNSHVHQTKKPSYIINLDPAVAKLPYGANIDIRETINYKEVMKQYQLGPNGAILTSLNLFTTKFDQVLNLIERRAPTIDYVLIDTPGQIEVFTWSASGKIMTETIASAYPTVVAYVVDTPRTTNSATFMSNMLYACSIMYKTRLPFVVVFNKIDVVSHEFAIEWMKDFESFQTAIQQETNYMSTLVRSMGLVLEEFYQQLKCVGVSSVTGEGMDDFFEAVSKSSDEYNSQYLPELQKAVEEQKKIEEERKKKNLEKFQTDSQGIRFKTPMEQLEDEFIEDNDEDDGSDRYNMSEEENVEVDEEEEDENFIDEFN